MYFGSEDNSLYCLDSEGTILWSYLTGGDIKSSPSIGSDGVVYIGSWDNKFYGIEVDGTLLWSYETGGQVYSSSAIDSDGIIYTGSNDNILYCYYDGPAGTPTETPTNTPTETPTAAPTETPTNTPTNSLISTPTVTPVPLALSVNKRHLSSTDTIVVTADLRIAGTELMGKYYWPYVRLVAYGQAPFYLVKGVGLRFIRPKPYLTGREGTPLRFRTDVTDYPLCAASFRHIPAGTYYLQAAVVRAVKCKDHWYATNIMGNIVNIPLVVQ